MTGSYSKPTPPREAVKEILLPYTGSAELREAIQVKVEGTSSIFSVNPSMELRPRSTRG